jgi:hypothetical protein
MYCKHCGKEIDKNYVFCWHCGKRVNPMSVVFPQCMKEEINAYTIRLSSNSGYYFIGDLGVGFVILDYNNKKPVVDTLFEDVMTQGREYVDSIWAKKNGKWGLINPITGVIVCDFIYDDISHLEEDESNGDIIVYSNGLCGKIDRDGNIIMPIIYDEIRSCGRVKYHGLWGQVRNGEQKIPCEYIKLFDNKYFDDFLDDQPSQYKNGKWGVIEGYYGKIILEFDYAEIKFFEGDTNYYIMRKGDKWGSKSVCGEIIPCEYSLNEIRDKARRTFDV